jgi:uncharacterized membrane protein
MDIEGSLGGIDSSTQGTVAPVDRAATLQRAVRKRLPALDGLRGLAVIIVVWFPTSAGWACSCSSCCLDF